MEFLHSFLKRHSGVPKCLLFCQITHVSFITNITIGTRLNKRIGLHVSMIIIIITLFESQIILAEHECCTNWGDCKSNKSNQIKCWFLRRGENRSSRRKTSRSRVENQQTQPTYDAGSGNRTRDTLVEGERSHHYTNPAPLLRFIFCIYFKGILPGDMIFCESNKRTISV